MAAEGNGEINMGNGDIKHAPGTAGASLKQQIKIQRILNEAQKFREELSERVNKDLEEYFESFVSDVEQITETDAGSNLTFNTFHKCESCSRNDVKVDTRDHVPESTSKTKKKQQGELPDKVFVTRRSVLTDLFEIKHIRSIYHVFIAILIIFSLNTLVMDIFDKGTLGLDFGLIHWALGKLPRVITLWLSMQMSTLLVVYPGFYYWTVYRPEGKIGVLDYCGLLIYLVYQLAFFILPAIYIIDNQLPPGSAVIVTAEQLRLMMKSHAFVRENFPKVLAFNSKDNKDHDVTDMCPDFSKYLYFLFAPTLVYRDFYPRTTTIRWSYVVSNFTQVFGGLLYLYYIFERFCVPVFDNFNKDHVTAKSFLISVFGCVMPGTLVLLIGFYSILHSWFNAFAEMLRFGDRMFYKDWWNTTSFASYYRTWNIVVHDWLYSYVYRDCYKMLGPKYRGLAMAFVFLISAVFHEYVICMAMGFFYPVLFVMFMGAGFGFMFMKGTARSWNIFLWLALFMGMGFLMCLYSMEWFARKNCPENYDHFLDYVIPRSWTCDFDALKSDMMTKQS